MKAFTLLFKLLMSGGCLFAAGCVGPKGGAPVVPPVATEPGDVGLTLEQRPFGVLPDGRAAALYCLSNSNGVQVCVSNYGGIITSVKAPDRDGLSADVVLGHNCAEDYIDALDKPYLGALIGRVGNRIADGHFVLDGQNYELFVNNGPNSLHGGEEGFDKKLWDVREVSASDSIGVELSRLSPDGEEHFPGNLQVVVRYTLNNDNELAIDYAATTDKATPINLTNHSYFNLRGEGMGDVLGHEVLLNADHITTVNSDLIPTGVLMPVEGGPFDFNESKTIGRDIAADDEQLLLGGGYDHNYVLNNAPCNEEGLKLCARVVEPESGRRLDVWTSEPGVQFYTANFLDGRLKSKDGSGLYQRHGGFCLETQHYPDSVNQPSFPNTVLQPGDRYRTTTVFRFGVAE